ncbi:Fructosamine/Ketosamine-3-kinase [Suillus paluster]|uniref:Fructosamine/Ketosamine-3-kinase n=1 Tax=Suillus paluster TaxID=48578 RepID=UPI001B879053|nr:Fructosamine/Ketosamine-3-kinase [Suillus paluster]KAG1754834.1 Fructosamine/Ketosamine-3-kinase [Suillus paluster]
MDKIFLPYLQQIEPHAQFTFNLPIIESSLGTKYFAKVGSLSEREQFVGEAESLGAIHNAAPGLAPRVFAAASPDYSAAQYERPYFLSEYRNITSLASNFEAGEKLGTRLATELHVYKSTMGFGFHVPTFCGATRQDNGWHQTWEGCYSAMIGGLLVKLHDKGRFSELCTKGEHVRSKVIPYLLRPLEIEPVLLHGDLWSGNVGIDDSSGQPVIFDPSSYYGHNEADLAIARIFGGFPRSFFEKYHEHLPKTKPVDQYELRADLYELYHYLNHTVLFGSSYAGSALRKMNTLLGACSCIDNTRALTQPRTTYHI